MYKFKFKCNHSKSNVKMFYFTFLKFSISSHFTHFKACHKYYWFIESLGLFSSSETFTKITQVSLLDTKPITGHKRIRRLRNTLACVICFFFAIINAFHCRKNRIFSDFYSEKLWKPRSSCNPVNDINLWFSIELKQTAYFV